MCMSLPLPSVLVIVLLLVCHVGVISAANAVRYVRVVGCARSDSCINVREVEAYQGPNNVARGKTTLMSSKFKWMSSDLAVDGVTSIVLFEQGFAATNQYQTEGSIQWWQVDLGGDYCISKVEIYNRADGGYGGYLAGATVQLRDKKSNVVYTSPTLTSAPQQTLNPGLSYECPDECAVGCWSTNGRGPCECNPTALCALCSPGTFNPNTGATSPLACLSCPPGTYNPNSGSASCEPCSVGTYNPSSASPSGAYCISCPAGKYSPSTGRESCTSCSAGTYNPNTRSASCELCSAGTYNPDTASTSVEACQPCPPGTYNPNRGNASKSACVLCASGTYNPNNGSAECLSCPPGKYSSSTGSVRCSSCSAGTYNPNSRSTSCRLCFVGTYNPNNESTSAAQCLPCPPGKYSPLIGSVSCSSCWAGSYNPNTGSNSSTSCLPCSPGAYAQGGQPSCTPCPRGAYASNASSHACESCPIGTYSPAVGAASCSPCPKGTTNHDVRSVACSTLTGSSTPTTTTAQSNSATVESSHTRSVHHTVSKTVSLTSSLIQIEAPLKVVLPIFTPPTAISVVTANPIAAGVAVRIALLAGSVQCQYDEDDVDPSLLQYPVFFVEKGLAANAIGVASATLLILLAVAIGTVCSKLKVGAVVIRAIEATLHQYFAPWIAFGTVLVARHSTNWEHILVVAVAATGEAVVLAHRAIVVLRDARQCSRCPQGLRGTVKALWEGAALEYYYGAFFEMCRSSSLPVRISFFVELFVSLLLGAIDGWRPTTGPCTSVAATMLVVAALLLIYIVALRPYDCIRDNLVSITFAGLQVSQAACCVGVALDWPLSMDLLEYFVTVQTYGILVQLGVEVAWQSVLKWRRRDGDVDPILQLQAPFVATPSKQHCNPLDSSGATSSLVVPIQTRCDPTLQSTLLLVCFSPMYLFGPQPHLGKLCEYGYIF